MFFGFFYVQIDKKLFTFSLIYSIIYITVLCLGRLGGKMKAKKIFFAAILFLMILASTACGGGEELCRIDGKEYTFVLYGNPNAISQIDVLKDGKAVGKVKPEYRVNEPWLDEDRENYGFELCDLNGDGHEDFVIKTVRVAGQERYCFYINDGGEFKLEEELSGAVAPVFGDGSVRVQTYVRIDQPSIPGEPPLYELRSEETVYGWSEHMRLQVVQVNRFSYFSETDIYRYSVYLPDEDGELEVDNDTWIYPEKLEEYGLEPLE